jgi:GxxExxY protein
MDNQTYQIIGAALEVHNELGCGFLEPVYQEALELELGDRCISFRPQVETPVFYKGRKLKAPLSCGFCLLRVDHRRAESIGQTWRDRMGSSAELLKSKHHERGLLINFGARSLEHRRFVCSHERS